MDGQLEQLKQSWKRSLRASGKSPKTVITYESAVDQFIDFLGSDAPHIRDIKRRHVENFMIYLLENRSAGTANNRYRALQQWFRWLLEEEEIAVSPMALTKAPPAPEVPVPIVGLDQLRDLLKACSGSGFEARRDTAIIRLFVDTGMRLSELTGLMMAAEIDGVRAPYVDLNQAVVWVLGKGSKWRACPIGVKTEQAIDRYLRVRARHRMASSPHLWVSSTRGHSGALTPGGVAQMIERRCVDAGLPKIHPHQFRHTFAHEWKAAGGSNDDLKRLGGWESDQMIYRYGKSAADDRAREAHRRLSFGDKV